MRRIYYFGLLLVFAVLFFLAGIKAGAIYPPDILFGQKTTQAEDLVPVTEEIPEDDAFEPDIRTVKLISAGNIMATETQISQAKINEDSYDFSPSFEYISPYLQKGDLVIGDLEVSQAGPDVYYGGYSGYTGWPLFNSPQELTEALYEAGINIFNLANNHALDRGYDGLMNTIDHIRGLGAITLGAYKNSDEQDDILIIEKNGINIALIGYTYSTNGNYVPEGHEYIVNHTPEFLDISPIIEDIQTANEKGADLIVVFSHWGAEHAHEPQPEYLRLKAEEMAQAGADLIIGGHPKWIQPLEWFFIETDEGSTRAALAAYSQGSFLTHQYAGDGYNEVYSEYSVLLAIDITKNFSTGDTWISDVDYEICWVNRHWQHRVLPLSDVFAASPENFHVNENQFERLKEISNFSNEVIEKYGYTEAMRQVLSLSEENFNLADDH
jgi:poly-gamma-glutamate capsule biosynthesis protein CapA/YwtB (metallophosphatase superfamily)